MYRSLRSALLGSPSWAVMVGREKMRMMEAKWERERPEVVETGDGRIFYVPVRDKGFVRVVEPRYV